MIDDVFTKSDDADGNRRFVVETIHEGIATCRVIERSTRDGDGFYSRGERVEIPTADLRGDGYRCTHVEGHCA